MGCAAGLFSVTAGATGGVSATAGEGAVLASDFFLLTAGFAGSMGPAVAASGGGVVASVLFPVAGVALDEALLLSCEQAVSNRRHRAQAGNSRKGIVNTSGA
jgi:hypothetical protein